MDPPTRAFVRRLLNKLYAYKTSLNERHERNVSVAWEELAYRATNTTSKIWAPMVQCWVDAGVTKAHILVTSSPFQPKGARLTIDQLIDNPRDFGVRCALRGISATGIEYDGPLDRGVAWEAVLEARKHWVRKRRTK